MLNKKIINAVLCLLLLIVMSCPGDKVQSKLKIIKIKMNNVDFVIEVAETIEEKSKGLMFRESMGDNEGMIFKYERDQKMSFYMKNTMIPLSIAFISADGKIQQIEHMEPLNTDTIYSRMYVRYALEVNQGVFEKYGIKVGDSVIFPEGFPY